MWARDPAVSPSPVGMVEATKRCVTADEIPIKTALTPDIPCNGKILCWLLQRQDFIVAFGSGLAEVASR
jgi:hypothetical protein